MNEMKLKSHYVLHVYFQLTCCDMNTMKLMSHYVLHQSNTQTRSPISPDLPITRDIESRGSILIKTKPTIYRPVFQKKKILSKWSDYWDLGYFLHNVTNISDVFTGPTNILLAWLFRKNVLQIMRPISTEKSSPEWQHSKKLKCRLQP